MRGRLPLALAGLLLFGGSDTQASSFKHFYYVGNAYTINNVRAKDAPLMTVGKLEIDVSRIPGRDLTNHRTYSIIDDASPEFPLESISTPDFRSISMDHWVSTPNNNRLDTDIRFDDSGQIFRWSVQAAPHDMYCFAFCYGGRGDARTGEGYDSFYGMFGEETFFSVPEERDRFLRGLGYTPKMSEYWKYFNDEDLWRYERYAPGAGNWFDNYAAAARQIEANTAIALANPARNIYAIAPIPLPAPLALLAFGIGALAVAARRRHTA